MMEEKFNDIIRHKLQSVQPEFNEQDWSKMHAKLLVYHPPSFWDKFGGLVKYGAGGLVLTGLVSTIIYLSNENKLLQEQLKNQASKEARKIEYVTKVDTVYITKSEYLKVPSVVEKIKYVYVKEPQIPDENSEKGRNQEAGFAPSPNILSQNSLATPEQRTGIVEAGVVVTNSENILRKQNANGKQRNNLISDIENKTGFSQTTGESNVGGGIISNQINASSIENSKVGQSETPTIDKTKTRVFEDLSVENIANIGLAKQFVVKQDNLVIKSVRFYPRYRENPVYKQREKFAVKKPSFKVPDFEFLAGAGVNQGKSLVGAEVWNELGFGEHWGLNYGIGYYKLEGPQYFNEDNFKREAAPKDFKNLHEGGVTKEAEIFNISIKSKLVSMPVSIYYKWQVNKTFTLLYSLGTKFNLKRTDNIDFITRNESKDYVEQNKEFIVKNSSLLNSIYFSTGLEADYRRWLLRAEPYFNINLKQNSNPNAANQNLFGIRLRAGYKVKK